MTSTVIKVVLFISLSKGFRGVKESSFSNPKSMEEYLAEHLIAAASNDAAAPSVKKKNELERVAQASR